MYKVIVPLLNPNIAEDMVHLAAALAGISSNQKEKNVQLKIVILGVVIVPEETPLSQGASLVKAYRTMLRYIPPETDTHIEVRAEVRVAREVWKGIEEQTREEEADLLLMYWKGSTQTTGATYGATIDALMKDPPCDMVLARFSSLPSVKNILIPVRGSGYSALSLRFATHMCERWGACVTVLHNLLQYPASPVVESETSTLEGQLSGDSLLQGYTSPFTDSYGPDEGFNTLHNLIEEFPPEARLVTLQGEVTSSIVREAAFHDMIMMGASGPDGQQTGENESLVMRISRLVNIPLLVVKTRRPLEISRTTVSYSDDERLAETIDRWFAQNIFHYREFRTMSSLTLLKDRTNTSISLIVPVYGKAKPLALAELVKRARFALLRDSGLVDEIIISAPGAQFDSEELNLLGVNEENQQEIVFLTNESQVAPDLVSGPGEALWNAMRYVRGDLVVWVDPRAASFEARHIYGLIGPLLTYPKFMLAAGFFSEEDDGESGPVHNSLTELSIRPLIGGFIPRLAGVIDPLNMIGAARREHLEKLPFFTGSGFQTGLLVDTLNRSGLMSIVQVDLGSPNQRQPHVPEQRIFSEVLSVMLRRVEDRTQSHLASFYNSSIKEINKKGGVYSLKVTPPSTLPRELPPPIYTPGYFRQMF